MAFNPSLERHPSLDDWLSVSADGRVRVRTGKVEIGQRICTALVLIVVPGRLATANEAFGKVREVAALPSFSTPAWR